MAVSGERGVLCRLGAAACSQLYHTQKPPSLTATCWGVRGPRSCWRVRLRRPTTAAWPCHRSAPPNTAAAGSPLSKAPVPGSQCAGHQSFLHMSACTSVHAHECKGHLQERQVGVCADVGDQRVAPAVTLLARLRHAAPAGQQGRRGAGAWRRSDLSVQPLWVCGPAAAALRQRRPPAARPPVDAKQCKPNNKPAACTLLLALAPAGSCP